MEELIERWNTKKIKQLEYLYEGPWKEVVLHLETQEITKIISPLFTRLLGIGVKKQLPAFSMDEGKGHDFKYNIDDGELLIEAKITLSKSNSWTGNYADKVGMHLLIRLNLNSDGKITGVFCCLVDESKCKGGWGDGNETNFVGLKFYNEDKKHMELIKGKAIPKQIWLGYELESVNSEEE